MRWLLALLPGSAEAACRQALALALDISGSVDAAEHQLQRGGLAAALTSPAVQAVLLAPGVAPVEIAVYEWSGPQDQALILPWTALTDEGALARVVGTLQATPRPAQTITTAIAPALEYGFDLLAARPDCWRRTLDISGDGKSNTGPRPSRLATPPGLADITVNGLVIGIAERPGGNWGAGVQELSAYFAAEVIRGPGAFIEVALGYEDYARAMERKLLRELETLATSDRGRFSVFPRVD